MQEEWFDFPFRENIFHFAWSVSWMEAFPFFYVLLFFSLFVFFVSYLFSFCCKYDIINMEKRYNTDGKCKIQSSNNNSRPKVWKAKTRQFYFIHYSIQFASIGQKNNKHLAFKRKLIYVQICAKCMSSTTFILYRNWRSKIHLVNQLLIYPFCFRVVNI